MSGRSPARAIAFVLIGAAHHRFHGPSVDLVAVAATAAVSWLGVPGPGEPVLLAAGVYAARGHVDLVELLLVAWLGATVGGTAGWVLGRRGGRAVWGAPGPLLRLRRAAMERGERFFARYGILAVYLAPSWVAGINDLPAARFLPANALCAAVWAVLVGGGGYLVGPSVGDVLGDLGLAGAIVLVGLAVVTIVAERARRRRGRSREGR